MQNPVFLRVRREPFAAFMLRQQRRFFQEKACGGIINIQPLAADILRDGGMVQIRILPAHGQFQISLAASRAVTGAGIAAGFAENGHHLMPERGRFLLRRHPCG